LLSRSLAQGRANYGILKGPVLEYYLAARLFFTLFNKFFAKKHGVSTLLWEFSQSTAEQEVIIIQVLMEFCERRTV